MLLRWVEALPTRMPKLFYRYLVTQLKQADIISVSNVVVRCLYQSTDPMSYFQWLMDAQTQGSRGTGPIKGISTTTPLVIISGVSDFVVFEAFLRAAILQVIYRVI